MKQIEGIDISKLAQDTEEELLLEKRTELRRVIRAIHNQTVGWEADLRRVEGEAVKLRDKIEKGKEKITKIKTGDWSVIDDPFAKKDAASCGKDAPEKAPDARVQA